MSLSSCTDGSFLLAIPTELRLAIYDYCLADTNTITITAAPVTVFGHRIKDRARRTQIPGLPLDLAPLVRYTYDPSLLDISNPATIPLDHGAAVNKISDKLPYPAPLALLQTCRLIHDELADYMRGKRNIPTSGGLSLYMTYPYGVLVLKALYPRLLKQAKNVYISGYYISPAPNNKPPELITPAANRSLDLGIPLFNSSFFAPMLTGSPPPPNSPPTTPPFDSTNPGLEPYPQLTASLAPAALASLIRTILPPVRASIPMFQKLEARILYPGETSYSSVWSDDNGPIVQVLKSTCGGRIDIEVSRGRGGNAVAMTVSPTPRSRVVSTTWRRLGSERRQVEGYVVGEMWGNDDEE